MTMNLRIEDDQNYNNSNYLFKHFHFTYKNSDKPERDYNL